ncbi:V-type proton ATPase subunit H-like, partial [Oscarella lobularis]|uniref:V-type proton ATPase subunit H-like n=1 Tax=Oscarella lobularis TaxID=121494 RepID=UPI00331448B8
AQLVLRGDHYRKSFVSHHCLDGLAKLLKGRYLSFQLQYQLIFCMWLLAFNAEIAAKLNGYGIVVHRSDILKNSIKIKVQRICIAALRNLAEKPENAGNNCQSMIQQRVSQVLKVLAGRSWEDAEVEADLQFLQETLSSSLQDLTSFDECVTEVKSGRLEWSPAHKSDKFWRENVTRFNDRGHEIIGLLLHLLEDADDPQTLAIASHDIGQYVRCYPRGKA